jgi:hypothetical protein
MGEGSIDRVNDAPAAEAQAEQIKSKKFNVLSVGPVGGERKIMKDVTVEVKITPRQSFSDGFFFFFYELEYDGNVYSKDGGTLKVGEGLDGQGLAFIIGHEEMYGNGQLKIQTDTPTKNSKLTSEDLQEMVYQTKAKQAEEDTRQAEMDEKPTAVEIAEALKLEWVEQDSPNNWYGVRKLIKELNENLEPDEKPWRLPTQKELLAKITTFGPEKNGLYRSSTGAVSGGFTGKAIFGNFVSTNGEIESGGTSSSMLDTAITSDIFLVR